MQTLFNQRYQPKVTLGFIIACVVVYAVQQLGDIVMPGLSTLITLLGIRQQDMILAGQWWRLLTAAFLHGSFFHLLSNCLMAYIWGSSVEAIYGRGATAVILLVSAIMGNLLGFAFSTTMALGFSGAVFGLLGALLAFGRSHRHVFQALFGGTIVVYVAISLILGFMSGNVDNWGHVGGLLGGFLAARAMGPAAQRQADAGNILASLGLVIVFVLLIFKGFVLPA